MRVCYIGWGVVNHASMPSGPLRPLCGAQGGRRSSGPREMPGARVTCMGCQRVLAPRYGWRMSSSSDPAALAVVDGTGRFAEFGPHYSRRTPGSKTFTGVGQEIVLVHNTGAAVWAVVRQKTPSRRGSGGSRGRTGTADASARYIWRNMLFRRLPGCPELASDLIKTATAETYRLWPMRYGELPAERLRTEIGIKAVASNNPGYCYKVAGYTRDRVVRGKLYLWAPLPSAQLDSD